MNSNLEDLDLKKISSILNFEQIPGWEAQKVMSPPDRVKLIDKNKDIFKEAKIAAVLLLLYQEDNRLKLPVFLRQSYKGVHSNQIGFPGGKVEKKDLNLQATAIRESKEEIGATPENIEILGKLTQLYIPPSNFMVHPFVGIYNSKPDFTPCDFEVKEIITIDLIDFISNTQTTTISLSKQRTAPAFELENGMKIWGATAMILNEFSVFVRKMLNL